MTRERLFGWVGSLSLQLFALGALGVSPYLSYESLPEPQSAIPKRDYVPVIEAKTAPAAPRRLPTAPGAPRNPSPFSRNFLDLSEIPVDIPLDGGVFDEGSEGVPFGIDFGLPDSVGAPPAAEEAASAPLEPIRPGGNITAPRKRHQVNPIYPPVAAAARVQGIVILEATIDEKGNVVNLRVLASIPLLDGAALDAVRQWKYEPTLLNGRPVPIRMSVSVRFELG